MVLSGAPAPLAAQPGLQLVAAVAVGTALGCATGLVPGLHANTVALALAGLAPQLPASGLVLAATAMAVGVAHTFLNVVPALAIGVPDAETAITALPGHRLVREGRGREAVRLSVLGSAAAVAVALPLAVPLSAAMERYYPVLEEHLALLLALVVLGLLAAERSNRARAVGAVTFLLAAALGWLTLDLDPAAPLDAGSVLAPLFAGLFGAPTVLVAAAGGGVPPQRDASLQVGPVAVAGTALAGAVAGAAVGYLPGVSAAIAAVAVLAVLPGGVTDRGYVVATSAVDSSNAIFALFALWAIGRPRSGVVVAVDGLDAELSPPVLVASALGAGAAAALVALVVGDRYLAVVGRRDPAWIAGVVLVLLVVLSAALAGTAGVAILFVATFVGLVPVLGGAHRVHCMGVLLGPLLLWV